VEVWGSYIVDN